MKETSIAKIKSVWEKDNTIFYPNKEGQVLEIVDQIASLFSAGSFYYYIINFRDLSFEYVHEGTREVLGIEPEDYSVSRYFDILHEEDLELMHKKEQLVADFLLNQISPEETPLYKVAYLMRLRHVSGLYKTILHQTKVINMSLDGKIQQVLGVHTDITHLNVPIDHKVSLISSKRPSYFSIATDTSLKLVENSFKELFTPREKEILKKISEGKSFIEIADLLYVSPHTINTHKKNILKKSHCRNTAELITKCIREGVILV